MTRQSPHGHPRPVRLARPRHHEERGMSVSTLFTAAMPAFILVAGLAVDGAARLATQRQAQVAAASAARVATDTAATFHLQDSAGDAQIIDAAVAAAHEYEITDAQVSIDPDGRVRVRTTAGCGTIFLGIIGIHELTVTGEAESELRRG